MSNYFLQPKLYLALLLSLRFFTTTFGQGGFPPANTERTLCYKTTTKEVQRLYSQVDYEKIATHELLRTKIVTYKKAFQVRLNENDQYIQSSRYEYHHNLFPDWHMVPDETIYDQQGTKQLFSSTSTIYKGGWFGHEFQFNKEGAYTTTDLRQGYPVHIYHVDHDRDGQRDYFMIQQTMVENGLLFPFKYRVPTNKELNEYQNQGYTVIQNANWIKIFNRDLTITYYLVEKRVVYEFFEDYKLIFKIRKFYQWNEEVSQDVLFKEIESTPYELSTGDCAESETTTVYSDYAFGCDQSNEETIIRSSDKTTTSVNLSIFPNPADDIINIHFPAQIREKDEIEISVYNQLGSLVKVEKSKGKINPTINVQGLQSGVYYMSIQVNQDFYSTHFIKN